MKMQFDDDDLTPLIERVVARVLDQRQVDAAKFGQRLAYNEPEGAALLGMPPHVLRDARLRGEIAGARIGKRIYYGRDELLKLLARNQTESR